MLKQILLTNTLSGPSVANNKEGDKETETTLNAISEDVNQTKKAELKLAMPEANNTKEGQPSDFS